MTVRTRTQLNSDADTLLPDNTAGEISPEDVRQRIKDLADSAKLAEDAATTTAAGIVELATPAEAATGTDATRAVTPAGLYFPTGHLYGLTLTNSGSDATNDIVVAAGTARDATDVANMVLASALTKQIDAAWAVGTNQGGLDTGSVANTTYYVWLIKRSDTGVVDVLFSTSASSPTMPTNYDLKRLIGYFVRASATNGIPVNTDRKPGVEYAGAAPVFACRAWVNFNGGGTIAINGSGNVSSITDNGTGLYTINFTTAMPDAKYAVIGIASPDSGVTVNGFVLKSRLDTNAQTASACQISTLTTTPAAYDPAQVCVAFFR